MAECGMHRYGGTNLMRREQRWPGLIVERVRWQAAPGTTGEICKAEHQLFVTVSGSAGTTRATAADGSRYRGIDFPGAVSFIPAGCHRRAQYGGGILEYIGVRIAIDSDARLRELSPRLRPAMNRADPLVHRLALALDASPRHPAGSLFADSAASLLLTHLLAVHPESLPARPLGPRALNRVLEYIEAGLGSDLRLAVLADVAGVSRHVFARAFREATGASPHRFVTERRLERAAALLRAADGPPIVEIAQRVGLSSQSHLTTAFGRAYGATPASYRAQHRPVGLTRRDAAAGGGPALR